MTRKVAMKFQEEWESLVKNQDEFMTGKLISNSVLRPFIFFITCLSIRRLKILARELKCMQTCFKILLESVISTGMLIILNHCSYNFMKCAVVY